MLHTANLSAMSRSPKGRTLQMVKKPKNLMNPLKVREEHKGKRTKHLAVHGDKPSSNNRRIGGNKMVSSRRLVKRIHTEGTMMKYRLRECVLCFGYSRMQQLSCS